MKDIVRQLLQHIEWLAAQIVVRDNRIVELAQQVDRLQYILKHGPEAE